VLHLGAGSYVLGNISGTANITASPNANVVVTGAVKPEGYVEIDIGTKVGTRYAEVGGYEYKISEAADNTKYGIIAGNEAYLVEITDVAETTTTRYFLVKNGSYSEVPMGNYMYNYDLAIRDADDKTEGETALRYSTAVKTASKSATEYTINEYGYIIGLQATLNNNGEQLNFEASKFVSGAAYIKDVTDKVFDQKSVANHHIFTGVLYGVPSGRYGDRIVTKTYTKVTVDGQDFVVYGEPVVESYYTIALKLKNSTDLTDEAKAFVDGIIDEVEDFGGDLGLGGDGLFG